MMFAVLGYQVGNADLQAALATARRHLQPGGLFFCDFWYGPAVLAERPSERVKVIDTSDGQIIRVATGELDARHDVCTVRYHVWRIEAGPRRGRSARAAPDALLLRPRARAAPGGSRLRAASAWARFPTWTTSRPNTTWNVALVARAI